MHINKKTLGFIIIVFVVVTSLSVVIFLYASPFSPKQLARELDFTVSGSSDCLRFLNSTVPTIYVPFTTDANENWQLTINCSKMSGGINGYTDVYIYDGYWDEGTNYKCVSSDLYPILHKIRSTDHQISLNSSFKEIFGGLTQQSYTVFFVVPPGGQQSTFHIIYQKL